MIKKSHNDQKEPFILYNVYIWPVTNLQPWQGKDQYNQPQAIKRDIAECNVVADKSVNDECVVSEYE